MSDLEPLRGMPMEYLYCQQCPGINSLAPLEGMPQQFHLHRDRIVALLRGMKLERFYVALTLVSDLAPLRACRCSS